MVIFANYAKEKILICALLFISPSYLFNSVQLVENSDFFPV